MILDKFFLKCEGEEKLPSKSLALLGLITKREIESEIVKMRLAFEN